MKIVKTASKIFCVLALFIIFLAGITPSIVSIKPVQNWIIERVNASIPGKIAIQELQIGWFRGIHLEGFQLKDPDERIVAECQKLSSNQTLFALLFSPTRLGTIELQSPHLFLIDDEGNGKFSIEKAFVREFQPSSLPNAANKKKSLKEKGEKKAKPKTNINSDFFSQSSLSKLFCDINITNGTLQIQKNTLPSSLLIKDLNCTLILDGKKSATINAGLQIVIGENQGSIEIKAQSENLTNLLDFYQKGLGQKGFGEEGSYQKPKAILSAKIQKLPMQAVDEILGTFDPALSKIATSLFGPTLDAQISHECKKGTIFSTLTIESANCKASMDFEIASKTLTMPKGATIQWQITPELFDILPKGRMPQDIVLLKPVSIVTNLAPCSFSLSKSLQQTVLPIHLNIVQNEPFLLKSSMWENPVSVDLQASIAASNLQEKIQLRSNVKTQTGNDISAVQLNADLNDIFKKPEVTIELLASGTLPKFVDLLTKTENTTKLLGNTLQLSGQAQVLHPFENAQEIHGTCKIETPLLKQEGAFTLTDKEYTFNNVQLSYNGPLQSINSYLPQNIQKISSINQLQLKAQFARITLPFTSNMMELEGSLQVLPMSLENVPTLGKVDIQEFRIEATKTKSQDLLAHCIAKLGLLESASKVNSLLGSDILINFDTSVSYLQNSLKLVNASATVKTDLLDIHLPAIECTLTPQVSYALSKPANLQYALKKDAFGQLLKTNATKLALLDDATVEIQVEPFVSNLENKPIKANCSIKPLSLQCNKEVFDTYNLTLPVSYDMQKEQLSGKLTLQSINRASSFIANFQLRSLPSNRETVLPNLVVTSNATFQEFPFKELATIFEKPELSRLFGDTLSGALSLDWNGPKATSNTCTASIKGTDFNLDMALLIGNEIKPIFGKSPLKIHWELDQARFQEALKICKLTRDEKQKALELQAPIAFDLECSKFHFPLEETILGSESKKPLGQFFDMLALEMEAHLSPLLLGSSKDPSKTTISLCPLKIEALLPKKTRTVMFEVKTLDDDNAEAKIFLKGDAKNLWDDEGFKISESTIKIESRLQNIPLNVLQKLSATQEIGNTLVAVIGPFLNANIHAEIEQFQKGTIESHVTGSRFDCHIFAYIKDGNLFLKEPLKARFDLTAAAAKILLKDVNPLLATAAKSEQPIELWVDSNDFIIPLKPFSKRNIVIKTIKIEPGILHVKNGGLLKLIVTLMKLRSLSEQEEMTLWFTPMYIEVRNGIVNCKRADALLANYLPIATWGIIDLNNDTIDMTLGLAADTLRSGFGLLKIDNDYMLQIPIRGPTNNPKIDNVRTAAKITALSLQGNKLNPTSLLGGLLQVAATVGENEGPIPPPTTTPFPWIEEQQNEKKSKKKHH